MPKTPEEVLGVPQDASLEDGRRVFRIRAKLLHPDRVGNDEDALAAAADLMAELNRAWEDFCKERGRVPNGADEAADASDPDDVDSDENGNAAVDNETVEDAVADNSDAPDGSEPATATPSTTEIVYVRTAWTAVALEIVVTALIAAEVMSRL